MQENFNEKQDDISSQEIKDKVCLIEPVKKQNLKGIIKDAIHFFSISFEKYDKETIFLLIFLYLMYFIVTSYVYISTLSIFPNYIKSILIFSLCFGISFLYYKNWHFCSDNNSTNFRKNKNCSKVLAIISSFLIFLSGVYNYIIFQQQNYNELILMSALSILCYFVYTIIYCLFDRILIHLLKKSHKKNINFVQQIQNRLFDSKYKKHLKIRLCVFIILVIVGIYLYKTNQIPKFENEFENYYYILIFVCIWILAKFLEEE